MAKQQTQLLPEPVRHIIVISIRDFLSKPHISSSSIENRILLIKIRSTSKTDRHHNPLQRATCIHNKLFTKEWTNIIKESKLL
jgi:hypothetical protein